MKVQNIRAAPAALPSTGWATFHYRSLRQYIISCTMRNLAENKVLDKLNALAKDEVLRIRQRFSHLINGSYHELDFGDKIAAAVWDRTKEMQRSLEALESLLDFLFSQVVERNLREVRSTHHHIFATRKTAAPKQEIEYNPALRFLENLKIKMECTAAPERLASNGKTHEYAFQNIMTALEFYFRFLPTAPEKQKLTRVCPIDGTAVTLPAEQGEHPHTFSDIIPLANKKG